MRQPSTSRSLNTIAPYIAAQNAAKATTTPQSGRRPRNQPARVAVDQLHMDPVDEQRAASEPRQRIATTHDDHERLGSRSASRR